MQCPKIFHQYRESFRRNEVQADAFKALNIEIKDQDGTLKDSSLYSLKSRNQFPRLKSPPTKLDRFDLLEGRSRACLLNTGAIGLGEFAEKLRKPEGSWERRRRMNSRHLTIKWIFFSITSRKGRSGLGRGPSPNRTCGESR